MGTGSMQHDKNMYTGSLEWTVTNFARHDLADFSGSLSSLPMFKIRCVLGVMLELGKGDSGSGSSSATLVVGSGGQVTFEK